MATAPTATPAATPTTTVRPTSRRPRRKPGEPETLPFTIAVDTREQDAWRFTEMTADSGRPLIVPTQLATLQTGDYSIVGMEHLVCVERKSAADLFSTLASGRERFEAEHARMTRFRLAVVVIEADWRTMIETPPRHSRLSPVSVQRTAVSWLVKYGVKWEACPGRRVAEIWTRDLLRKFWETEQEREREREQERLRGEI